MKKLLVFLLTLMLMSTSFVSASADVDFSAFDWDPPAETVTITYYDGQELPETCEKKQALMHEFMLKYFNIDLQRIVFENDVYGKIDESNQHILKYFRENNLFNMGKSDL